MDDLLSGGESVETTRTLVQNTFEILTKAGMPSHKWVSNKPAVLETIPKDRCADDTEVKELGILWHIPTDKLKYPTKEALSKEAKITKRITLAEVAKLFDPMGLVSPVTLRGKHLMQKTWAAGLDWDEELPPDLRQEFNAWHNDFRSLTQLGIDRKVVKKGSETKFLAAFGDASSYAYATAIYLVTSNTKGDLTSNLVFSKTRVKPLDMSDKEIPRLELLAALITARAGQFVKDALKVKDIYYFTDSLITLHRINHDFGTYKMWVGNRVKEIQDLSNKTDWFYVKTGDNPADIACRGALLADLIDNPLWWKGPPLILDRTSWNKGKPHNPTLSNLDEKEMPKTVPRIHVTADNQDVIDKLARKYESWRTTANVLAYIMRFLHKISQGQIKWEFTNSCSISPTEFRKAEKLLLRQTQRNFSDDIDALINGKNLPKGSKLKDCMPIWDNGNKVLLMQSRLRLADIPNQEKNPMILPKNNHIVEKYVKHIHKLHLHCGPEQTLALTRRQVWLLGGRREVKRILHACKCKKPQLLQQVMAPLPPERAENPSAFQHIAVDFFGPMLVPQKVYGCIFSCFQSRAIHLELLDNMETTTFLQALRRLAARRGHPTTIVSDNAKTFKAAASELRRLLKAVNWPAVIDENTRHGTKWIFATEKAPWSNALAERMVRTIKTALRTAIGTARLNRSEMETLLIEVEGIVNNRPLGIVSSNPEDPLPITPAELAIGRQTSAIPDDRCRVDTDRPLSKLWLARKRTLNAFWRRWRSNYLLDLQVTKKWHDKSAIPIKPGLVVQIRDDNVTRGTWLIGRIMETHAGRDGMVRSATIKTTKGSLIRRPVQRLAVFEFSQ